MEFIHSSYSLPLVMISVAAAILSSYVALELANTASDWRSRRILNKWLLLSAFALGLGIWTMHFIGMFAMKLPIPIYYEGWRTILSLLIAVAASFIGFSIVHKNNTLQWAVIGGVVMGLGIAGMHYLGMSGIRLGADMHYDPALVALSVLIAIVVSSLGLWILVTMKAGIIARHPITKVATAILMGTAISSMHYTGMAAMRLTLNDTAVPGAGEFLISGDPMVATLSIAAIILILLPLFSVSYENRFSRRLSAELVLLRSNESRLRKLIENAPDAFFVYNDKGQFLDVNRVACEQLGYDREELLASSIFDIGDQEEAPEQVQLVWPSLETGEGCTIRSVHVRKDGSKFPVEINITGLIDKGSRQMFALARDITETEKLKAHLSKLAMTDELTGLYNRRAFMLTLDKELATASRYSRDLSLLVVDIDYFKKINDQYGHPVGDVVLKHFAQVALKTIRSQDTLGRVGGEEFAVILPETNIVDAVTLAERFRSAMEYTSVSNNLGTIKFTVSVGIACFDQQRSNSRSIVKNADAALYAAKGAGRNRVNVFDETPDNNAD